MWMVGKMSTVSVQNSSIKLNKGWKSPDHLPRPTKDRLHPGSCGTSISVDVTGGCHTLLGPYDRARGSFRGAPFLTVSLLVLSCSNTHIHITPPVSYTHLTLPTKA